MREYIKMIDELVLIKASLQLIETDNKKTFSKCLIPDY